jgi:hypothetical protein
MTYSSAYPQIKTGGVTGLQADDPVLAYGKYNVHGHDRVTPADFRCYDISLGDSVYLYNLQAEEILATTTPATVTYLSAGTLRVSLSATETITNGTIYLRGPQTDATVYCIHGIDVLAGSNLITFYNPLPTQDFQQLDGSGLPGFVRPADWARISTYCFSGVIDVTAPVTHPMVLSLPNKSWVTDLFVKSVGFGSSIRLKVSGVAAGSSLTTVSNVTASRAYSQATGTVLTTYPTDYLSGPVAAGSNLDLEVISNTASGKLHYQLGLKVVVA